MKNKPNYIVIVLLLLAIIGTCLSWLLVLQNGDLKTQIERRDALLHDTRFRDSLFNIETKRYSDTISKYIDVNEITVNDKSVTIPQFLDRYNELNRKNLKLYDSLYKTEFRLIQTQKDLIRYMQEYNKIIDSLSIYKSKYQALSERSNVKYKVEKNGDKLYLKEDENNFDTAFVFKRLVALIKSKYGINYTAEKNGNYSYSIDATSPRLDSALMLLRAMGSKLFYDSTTKKWGIRYN